MEKGAIPDGQISASSEWKANHAASQGRLHFQTVSNPLKSGSWSARTTDANQWLQIDLGAERVKVTGVATQGRNGHCCQWVKKYKLQYSDNGVSFLYHREQGQTTDKVRPNWSTKNLVQDRAR